MPHRSRPLVAPRLLPLTPPRQRPPLAAPCARATELAHAAHDGELQGFEAAALSAHAEPCPRCRRALPLESHLLDLLRARLRGVAGAGAPAAVHARIRARLRAAARAHADLRA